MEKEKLYSVELTAREICELATMIGITAWKVEKELERITQECDEFTSEGFLLEYPNALMTPDERLADIEKSLNDRTIDVNNIGPMFQRISTAQRKIENFASIEKFERSIHAMEHIADLYSKE
ncbi:hypothetical protein [Enterococcus rivorum]|uniref:Uncharacterized protein n=1 Tax=Enterococcus rivorum TaxID=762845 RepID=A0A1E5L0D1_9ENTE|nr:hypothetical protein [Enterococcus rivorum]MBP2098850.1 hypothetical protein [Enterococcus rivorum]OEH83580.1 hypothetical protein BCR26_08865 [Enterococcus rivorum]